MGEPIVRWSAAANRAATVKINLWDANSDTLDVLNAAAAVAFADGEAQEQFRKDLDFAIGVLHDYVPSRDGQDIGVTGQRMLSALRSGVLVLRGSGEV